MAKGKEAKTTVKEAQRKETTPLKRISIEGQVDAMQRSKSAPHNDTASSILEGLCIREQDAFHNNRMTSENIVRRLDYHIPTDADIDEPSQNDIKDADFGEKRGGGGNTQSLIHNEVS